MGEDARRYAVYDHGIGYNDETFYVERDPELTVALTEWRNGLASKFHEAWRAATVASDWPPQMVSLHASLDEADTAAAAVHRLRCGEMTIVDFGFHDFGCAPEGADDGEDDMGRLTAWCEAHDVQMPSLDASKPNVRNACEAVAERAQEGSLWLDLIGEPDGGLPFAADLAVDSLRQSGKEDLVGSLYQALIGSFTFVGPAPMALQSPTVELHAETAGPPTSGTVSRSRRKSGFLSRLFRR